MNKIYFIPLSLMVSLALFFILSLLYDQNVPETLKLNQPIQIVLKSTQGEPMDFWHVVNRGMEEAAREFGVEIKTSGPLFEKEIDLQIQILNSVIDKKPPLLILAASDYTKLVEPVERAKKLGIPVITMDSGVQSNIPASFIATDNIEAGRKAGMEITRLMQDAEHPFVAIVSHIKETATAIDREKGVRQALDPARTIGTWFCDVEQDKAYLITLELLKNTNIGGIVALNEVAALGVARAIEETGSKDRVAVVGFDNAVRELSFLEEGVLKATVVQRPYNMGYLSVKTAVDFLKGKQVAPFIDTGSILITPENMFSREYQELLFPFINLN